MTSAAPSAAPPAAKPARAQVPQHVVDEVMHTPAGSVRPMQADVPQRYGGLNGAILAAQRTIGNRATTAAIVAWRGGQAAVPGTAGQPLNSADRALFETAFDFDLNMVRIHADRNAATSAARADADAYTVGRDIIFAAGRYAPGTPAGRLLLAHELSHVIQQWRGQLSPERSGPASAEADADQAGRQAAVGQRAVVTEVTGTGMARQPATATRVPEQIENLQDEELELEYENVRVWLLDPKNAGDPAAEKRKAYLAQLESVLTARNPQLAARIRRQETEAGAVRILGAVGSALPGFPHPEIIPFLVELGAGMGERLEQLPRERIKRQFVRYLNMPAADQLQFAWGYIKGIGIGVWEEIKGIGELVILPFTIIRWLVDKGADLIANWDSVSGRASDLMQQIGAAGHRAGEEIGKALANPAEAWRQLDRFFQAMVQSGLQKANQWGRQAADQVLGFLEQGTEEVGRGVGVIVGRILFNVLLLVATDAIGNLLKEGAALAGKLASTVVSGVSEAVSFIGRFLPKVIKAVKWLGEEVLTFLKETFRLLTKALEALLDMVKSLHPKPVAEAVGPGGIRMAVPVEEEGSVLMSSVGGKIPTRSTQTTVEELYGRSRSRFTSAEISKDIESAKRWVPEEGLNKEVGELFGFGERPTPGGPIPKRFDLGNFAHDNAEYLIEDLPKGLRKEYPIRVPGRAGVLRADRVDQVKGIVYEVKPKTARWIAEGEKQGELYARWLDEVEPLGPDPMTGLPRRWRWEVKTYDANRLRRAFEQVGELARWVEENL